MEDEATALVTRATKLLQTRKQQQSLGVVVVDTPKHNVTPAQGDSSLWVRSRTENVQNDALCASFFSSTTVKDETRNDRSPSSKEANQKTTTTPPMMDDLFVSMDEALHAVGLI